MRDAMTADLDLRELLILAKVDLAGRQPVAAVLCTCNGRGLNMFGESHHDARLLRKNLRICHLRVCSVVARSARWGHVLSYMGLPRAWP